MSKTKVILEGLIETRERLNGVCGGACPVLVIREKGSHRFRDHSHLRYDRFDRYIRRRPRRNSIHCRICKDYFGDIQCKYPYTPCPCNRKANPEEIFLRLDESIDELTAKLSKEYSS